MPLTPSQSSFLRPGYPEEYPIVPYLHRLNRKRLLQDKCRTLLINTVRQKLKNPTIATTMPVNEPPVIPSYEISFTMQVDGEDITFATIQTDLTPMSINVGDIFNSAFLPSPFRGERPRFYEVVQRRHCFIYNEGEFHHNIALQVTGRSEP